MVLAPAGRPTPISDLLPVGGAQSLRFGKTAWVEVHYAGDAAAPQQRMSLPSVRAEPIAISHFLSIADRGSELPPAGAKVSHAGRGATPQQRVVIVPRHNAHPHLLPVGNAHGVGFGIGVGMEVYRGEQGRLRSCSVATLTQSQIPG